MTGTRTTSVVVWRQPDDLWRWRWVERDGSGEELTSLVSHKAFESASAAESSAREAYPGVAVHLPNEATDSPRRRSRRFLWLGLAVAGIAATAYRTRHRRARIARAVRATRRA